MDQRPPESGRTPAPQGGQPRPSCGGRFRWDERLHRKSDFKRVFKEGRRVGGSGLMLWVCRREDEESGKKPRLGLAIPKAYGNAVARNRLKRLIREAFRLNKAQLPSGVD